RQVAALAAFQVHRVDVEVLVAAAVAHVQQGVGAVGPEIAADAAGIVVGDRAGLVDIVGRGHPDVEHALDRGDPAQPAAVRADLHVGALGVAEQRLARDQVDLFKRGRPGRGRGLGPGSGLVAVAAAAGGHGKRNAGSEDELAPHGLSPLGVGTATIPPAGVRRVCLPLRAGMTDGRGRARYSRTSGVWPSSAPGRPRTMSAPTGTWMLEPARSPIGSARPPRQVDRKPSATALNAMLFSGRAKPWPSSGNST